VIGKNYQWKKVGLYANLECHKAQAITAESVIPDHRELITIPSIYPYQNM
jgi:hypothetical protein